MHAAACCWFIKAWRGKKIVVIVIKASAPHSGYFANALNIFNVFFFQFLFPTQASEAAVSAAFHPATSSC